MKKPRPYILGYIVVSSADIPCRVDTSLHQAGVLVPAKAGEQAHQERRQTEHAHPERGPLARLRTLIRRSQKLAKDCKHSLHRDHPAFSTLIHSSPYQIQRVWKRDDGYTYRRPLRKTKQN